MADLLAGTTVKALDTPPTVGNVQNGQFTFTNTTFGISTTGGTYVDCGVAFVAPTTGRVKVSWSGLIVNSGANSTRVCPVIRTGTTVGSGTTVFGASLSDALVVQGTDGIHASRTKLYEGLTPGDSYNVRLEHRVVGGTGTAEDRDVIVAPAT